jgi:hypothetical protein
VAKASIKSSSKTSTVDHPKTLIIAEKPSVANDIAKALGGLQSMKIILKAMTLLSLLRLAIY